MSVRVRLAPSPTGNLHIGTARTAVFNWLFARNQKGKFILRIEDTDVERSRTEYTDNIMEGLSWLGLEWDEGPFYQSQRLELYQKATQELLDKGLAYRCYCTAAELEEMREAQKGRKEAPRYDNRHRNLTPKQQAAFEAEGREPVIRFKIDDERIISWNDMVRGKVTWKGSDLGGDMVISRAASGGKIGQALYNMAVVVDDMDMKITHVIRGEDHIANTAKQILLYEALEGKVPIFGHTPLILNKEGRKLSKRDGVTSISDFKELGFTPEALANYMCLLGWTPPDATQEIFTLAEAAEKFSFVRVNKAGAKFDWDKLDWISSQYLHSLPIKELTDKLIPVWQKAGYELDPKGDRSWLEQLTTLIGPSLTRLVDAVEMSKLFFSRTVELDEKAAAQMQDENSVKSIICLLEMIDVDAPLEVSDAQQTIKQVTQKVNVKKGIVMKSLRASLTGAMQGPDLIQSWLLLHQKGFDILRFQKSLGQEIEKKSITEEKETKTSVSTNQTPELTVEKGRKISASPSLATLTPKVATPTTPPVVDKGKAPETKTVTPTTPPVVDKGKVAETKVATPTTPPVVDKDKVAETKVATPTTPPVVDKGKAPETKVATPTTPPVVDKGKAPETKVATSATSTPVVDKGKVAETKVATPTTPPVVDKGKAPETKTVTPTTPPVVDKGKAPETKVATPTTPPVVDKGKVAETK
ncbi:MAG: glutamate--tRNA ligase, partial [Okeania sp.]